MKNIFKTFIMIAAAFVMAGCLNHVDDSGFDPQTPNISFSEENLTIDQNGGELTVRLNSNLPWRVTSDVAWLTVSDANGLEGKELVLTVGYSHPVTFMETDDISIEVPGPNKIIISGSDKQKVGQFAAEVREVRPPEPYKGKGIKYVDEYIRRKEGKAGKGGK